jgi:hypothetical protein
VHDEATNVLGVRRDMRKTVSHVKVKEDGKIPCAVIV